MTAEQVAQALLRARERLEPVSNLPAPASLLDAYVIQDKMAAEVGDIGGWKIGASGLSDEPVFAPMPRAWMTEKPANSRLRGVEVEIAFQLGRGLPARSQRYTREEVTAAIAGAHPAIEIIESGLADPDSVPRPLKIADLQIHGGFVPGPAIANWRALNWPDERVTLRINGHPKTERVGSNAAIDLIRLVVYLANQGSSRTGGLKAGQWITTGSWTGVYYCAPHDSAEGQFSHSEPAGVSFA